jgi:hypothetical protein
LLFWGNLTNNAICHQYTSYAFNSALKVDHDFDHQSGSQTVNKLYTKDLLAEITLLGIDEDTRSFHFELQISSAEWAMDSNTVEPFRRDDGVLPIEQSALNDAYARAHTRPFYYVQSCDGQITRVFHPKDEQPEVVATKKMFVQQLSHNARADGKPHTADEHDNHGKRSTAYEYEPHPTDAGMMSVKKSFDVVREYRPPADMRQTGDAWNTWRARTADEQTTELHAGIVKRIVRTSALDFPPTAASYRGNVGAKRSVADANAIEEEEVKGVKGNSFWLRARGTSTLTHTGARKRSAADLTLLAKHETGANFHAHLEKRHALDFEDAAPHELDESSLPGPGSIEETIDELLEDDAEVEAAIQLHLLLKHKKTETLSYVDPLLDAESVISDLAHVRLLRVLAEVGTDAEQALLRDAVEDAKSSLTRRGRAVVALRGLMRPNAAVLATLRALMRTSSAAMQPGHDGMAPDTESDALRKHATLVFGILAENVNASDVAAAREMRIELLQRVVTSRTPDEAHVALAALDNAYPHDMANELVVADRDALAELLTARYAADEARRKRTVLLTKPGVNVLARRDVLVPDLQANDTTYCDAATMQQLNVVFRDRMQRPCTPCNATLNEACAECNMQTVMTGQACMAPRCANPEELECGAREVMTMVNADGVECGQNGVDNQGQMCMPQECAACTDCRTADGMPCGSLCMSANMTRCPNPPSWFQEQFTMFFGADLCMGTERFKQCAATVGRMYNDVRPLRPDWSWHKKIGGKPVTGKIEAVLDAATTDNARLRVCGEGEDPFNRQSMCKRADKIDWKVFAGAWAGLEAYEEGNTYDYNPNAARLEVASAYLQVRSSVSEFWRTANESMQAASENVCQNPIEFALYYNFAGKTYYHETTRDVIGDTEGRSTCFVVDQTCTPQKPPQRAWRTSTKDLYTRYMPDLLGNFDLSGIPLKLELIVKSEARVHHAVSYQYNELEGGLMLSGFVEPQADCIVTMTASIAWAARFGNTDEAATAQEMRNLIRVGIKAHIEVFAVEFPAIGAINFETSQPCANVELHTRALGGRVDIILEVMGINVLAFLGSLFGIKQTLYEWKGIEFDVPFLRSKCCKLCPGSCQAATLEANRLNGANSRCDFTKGECVCTPGWDGAECMIPCPESCEVDVGVLCDVEKEFTVGNGKFAPRGRCVCGQGSWGYDCSLACPGGRENPCSGHTDTKVAFKGQEFLTCNSDGTCDCWDFPPRGPWFGERCDITCGDPAIVPPADDPDWTRCGRIGESHAECRYDIALGAAECKCGRSYYGPKCDQVCPVTNDDRKAPCSLRGDCEEVDGKAVCLCDLGFYGEVCEFIAFDGSGIALAFDGADAAAQVEYPLSPIQLSANAKQGFTMMLWFQAHKLPDSARGATLMKWRWGELRLQKDGTVGLCDAQSCLATSGTVAAGTDEKSWYWVAGAMQTTEIGGVGARKIWLMKADAAAVGAPAQDQLSHAATGGDGVVVGAAPFAGLIDHVHILHRMATENDLVDFRVGTVAFSTPAVLFQALCDEGRGDHVYAEWPFIAGAKHASVRYARSFVPLQWATLNTEIAPPLKVWDPTRPAIRSYAVAFDGKRVTGGKLSFRALSPMATGRKRLVTCRISAFLIDPLQDLNAFDANNQPLNDDQLRAADMRARYPIFENLAVSGSDISASLDPIVIQRDILERLRTGSIDLEFRMAPNQPDCNRQDRPLIIENSFITLQVAQVDGVVQTVGLDNGYASATPTGALQNTWSLEMWVYLEAVRRDARLVADSALVMLYESGAQIDLVNKKSDFAIFLLGDTNRGVQVKYPGSTATVNGYDIEKKRADWFHLALIMRSSGSQCTPELYVDSIKVGVVQGASCSGASVQNWGAATHTLRVGSKFEGRFNDVILWNTAIDPKRTMHMSKDYTSASMLFGYNFDDRAQMSTQSTASLKLADATGKTQGIGLVRGVIRGHIYGHVHRWKYCPGVDEALAPERVCGNTLVQERGVCFVEDEENEGVLELTYKCKCNEGFAGRACQVQCLGAVKVGGKTVLCSGRGKCISVDSDDEVMCDCDEGFAGDACEFKCPGWDTANPPGQKECNGKGQCQLNPARTAAICKCNANSQAYGLACEYNQNELPIRGCSTCTGLNEVCNDGVCDCEHPYYRVGDNCQRAQNAATLTLSAALVATTIATIVF